MPELSNLEGTLLENAVAADRPLFAGRYRQFLELGLQYFIPSAILEQLHETAHTASSFSAEVSGGGSLEFDWLGYRYRVHVPEGVFSDDQLRLIRSIGKVLSIRYQLAFRPVLAAETAHLFRGLLEDQYVSAFLDSATYRDADKAANTLDRVADAIEVLRLSAMSTYENRRISTGVLLFGSQPDPCHKLPSLPDGALRYSIDLTSTRSFHQLSDGLKTAVLVNLGGLLVEVVDVEEWAEPFHTFELPEPVAPRYEPHCRATVCGGHIFMILTPNGEIKLFANGSQVFAFRDGHWRLTNTAECYRIWQEAIGNEDIAKRIFRAALNLGEDRRGALFVVLDDPSYVERLVSPEDLLNGSAPQTGRAASLKRRFHYLLRDRNALTLSPTVLETVARIDGAIVLDRDANLLSFGAILQNAVAGTALTGEGGRTAAAMAASHFGSVIKVSEDGMISCFRGGKSLWDM